MRKLFVSVVLMGLTACAKQQSYEQADNAVEQAGPSLAVTAAPGVAFNYRYAFRLPNARIATVQEQHAQACERLGVNRCRITGMRYRLIDEDHVSAMLAFKLDPTIARQFGKDGIAAVQKAEGMLVDSEINGVDVGSTIKRAEAIGTRLQQDLDRIEAELKRSSLKSADRARLESRAAELREQLRGAEDLRADNQENLASTPMVFEYGSGGLIPGFEGSPLKQALASAARSFVQMLSFIIIALGALAPWAIIISLALIAARSKPISSLWRRLFPRQEEAPAAA